MSRPRLLDRFCGEGGAAMGYHLAGFDVVGVDLHPQPRYPFTFVQGDALDPGLIASLGPFDAQHASPPCQARSKGATKVQRATHPRLIAATRVQLIADGIPYVIENVPATPGAEDLTPHLRLCACMFDGLGGELRRERWFETSPVLYDLRPPCNHTTAGISVNRRGGRYNGPGPRKNTYISLGECKRIMGIDWMTQNGLGEAIPPPMTQYIGELLRARIGI